MRKWICLLLITLSSISIQLFGQRYGTAAGMRLGNNNDGRSLGLSVQHRVMKQVTLEGILQTNFRHTTTFHALIEKHQGILANRLNFYYGAGLSLGNEESTINNKAEKEIITTYGNTTFGTDVILGLELTLVRYNISLDYKPNFNIAGKEQWYQGQFGFTARKVLVKGSTQNKRKRQRQRARNKESKAATRDGEKSGLEKFYNKTFKKDNE